MDEADEELLEKMVKAFNANRKENWVDVHNLRVIKYGSILHVDCHLTVPWYLNVNEAHAEIEALGSIIKRSSVNQLNFLFTPMVVCMCNARSV